MIHYLYLSKKMQKKKGGMIHQKLNHPEFWQKIISLFASH
ncbi:hypothetical protein HMPREF1623_05364 [Escherichia coli 910096-2]|nr:hypothetical protein HMPREF1623_05364 [Escherichia coli 910096-2]